jgi:hypothetical protein
MQELGPVAHGMMSPPWLNSARWLVNGWQGTGLTASRSVEPVSSTCVPNTVAKG